MWGVEILPVLKIRERLFIMEAVRELILQSGRFRFSLFVLGCAVAKRASCLYENVLIDIVIFSNTRHLKEEMKEHQN